MWMFIIDCSILLFMHPFLLKSRDTLSWQWGHYFTMWEGQGGISFSQCTDFIQPISGLCGFGTCSLKIGRGFAAKGRFKNWYKQGFLGILDFMLINGRVAWSMSAEMDGVTRQKINNKNWQVYVLEDLSNWVDPLDKDVEPENEEDTILENFYYHWWWYITMKMMTRIHVLGAKSIWYNVAIPIVGYLLIHKWTARTYITFHNYQNSMNWLVLNTDNFSVIHPNWVHCLNKFEDHSCHYTGPRVIWTKWVMQLGTIQNTPKVLDQIGIYSFIAFHIFLKTCFVVPYQDIMRKTSHVGT